MNEIPVIVTTSHRGVFFGYASEGEINRACSADKRICIKSARCAIYWGTDKGIGQLCDTGPTDESRIGAQIPFIYLNDVTAVFGVTNAAAEKWESAE